MSNERPDPADDGALSGQERRRARIAAEALDSAFAARLADVTPRSLIDVGALQYEAGYRAGIAERRKTLRITQGFAVLTTAAMLFATVSSWMNYEAFVGERQALLAMVSEQDASPNDEDRQATTVATDDLAPEAIPKDDADETPDPPKRSLRPRGADVIAAGAAMERRYLTPQRRSARSELQWKDLYNLSTQPISTTGFELPGSSESGSAPAASPSAGEPASPWSAWPGTRQVDDLLEQGI